MISMKNREGYKDKFNFENEKQQVETSQIQFIEVAPKVRYIYRYI